MRVLFRILGHSIFKNDPNLNNFSPNYVPNSRKILQTELFNECMTVAKSLKPENQETHGVVTL